MAKRVFWRKGMRLTEDILRASDNCHADLVTTAFSLAAVGRFGLFPSLHPFEISVSISNGIVDVESLTCLALTKGGQLIDVEYDTKFSNAFETRVQIPDNQVEKAYLLLINAEAGQWRESNDGYEMPVYSFSLIACNSPIPNHSFPIARIIDDFVWRMDEQDFVPPCLFVSSHIDYQKLLRQYSEILSEINNKTVKLLHSNGKEAIRVFWPIVQQLIITVDKECDLMTPMSLLANVQKCVSAFTCACELDEYLNFKEADRYRNYVMEPYDYKDAYQKIKEGLDLCFSISGKIDIIGDDSPVSKQVETPVVSPNDLIKNCMDADTVIFVAYPEPNATIYFTIDGSEPTTHSQTANKTNRGFKVVFNNGLSQKAKGQIRKVTLQLMAVVNGEKSAIGRYQLELRKAGDAIPI